MKLPLPGSFPTWINHELCFPTSAVWGIPWKSAGFCPSSAAAAEADGEVLVLPRAPTAFSTSPRKCPLEQRLLPVGSHLISVLPILAHTIPHPAENSPSKATPQRNLSFIPPWVPALRKPHSRPGELNPFAELFTAVDSCLFLALKTLVPVLFYRGQFTSLPQMRSFELSSYRH